MMRVPINRENSTLNLLLLFLGNFNWRFPQFLALHLLKVGTNSPVLIIISGRVGFLNLKTF